MRSVTGPDLSNLLKLQNRVDTIRNRLDPSAGQKKTRKFVDVLQRSESIKINNHKHSRPEKVEAAEIPQVDRAVSGRLPAQNLEQLIREKANRYGVDENLVRSVIRMESGGQPRVVSKAGAMGLMQLMPSTARMLDVEDPFDPGQNVDGGVRYLKRMLDRFGGDRKLALAAYHSGPTRVSRYGGIPPYPAVNHYVKTVLAMTERMGK